MARNVTSGLFRLARISNLFRHAGKGTMGVHLIWKALVRPILRALSSLGR